MNDFTKEELQIIAIDLNINFNRNHARKLIVPQSMLDLIKKVTGMIDNYCDHTPEPVEQEICCIKCQKTLI